VVQEAGGDLLEQHVTDRVTEGVVDLLEPVEVEQQGRAVAAAVDEGLQPVVEQGAVAQAGQGVVSCVVAQLVDEPAVVPEHLDVGDEGLQQLEVVPREGAGSAQSVAHLEHRDDVGLVPDRHQQRVPQPVAGEPLPLQRVP
jgi:hypothetical protein